MSDLYCPDMIGCTHAKCKFAHSKGELSWILYRTVMCYNGANCTHLNCVFAHNKKELSYPGYNILATRSTSEHLCPRLRVPGGSCYNYNCTFAHHIGALTSFYDNQKIQEELCQVKEELQKMKEELQVAKKESDELESEYEFIEKIMFNHEKV